MTRLEFGETAEHFGHQLVGVFKAIRPGAQHHDGKGQVREVLLVWQAFVHCQEDAVFRGGGEEPEEFAIFMPDQPARGTV